MMAIGKAMGMAVAGLAGLAGAAAQSALAQEPVLKRVMLSAGGVGYYEYEAAVEGDVTLPLSVRLDQVDDVLKSIVVYDDKGTAGTISLPGREPLAQIFRDLPFGPEALESPVALLNALPGAGIRATGGRQIEGKLVRVVPEEASLPNMGGTITRNRVTVMTDAGMQSFLFEEADSVVFTDPGLRAQIDAALSAVAAHRTRDRRTLEVVSRGQGRRILRVGYVVAVPLWKASYRLALGDETAKTARLQGWAVLENMSGRDWNDVELTLVSGNPVTFRQALYSAYYVSRPEVPVEVLGRVLPSPDTGVLDMADLAAEKGQDELRARSAFAPAAPPVPDVFAGAATMMEEDGLAGAAPMAAEAKPEPAPGQARILAAASQEAATQVTFRVPYPVSVSSGRSLLVPVIDRAVPATRIALYQPTTHDRHPLASVRLRNDSETGLPPGVLTLYEGGAAGASYVGDAQLSTLPAGEERLVSFALDQKTLVDREMASEQTLTMGRIARGVLELTWEQRQSTVYRLKAPAGEPRDVLIEHPRMRGWTIVTPDGKQIELADEAYRIPRALKAGERADLTVVMTRPRIQTIGLVDLGATQFMAFAGEGKLDAKLRRALERMAELRGAIDAQERRQQELEMQRNTIYQEQQRIRDNLSRVPADSDLQRRYLQKLGEQEDAMEKILATAGDTRAELDTARKALADYVAGLDL